MNAFRVFRHSLVAAVSVCALVWAGQNAAQAAAGSMSCSSGGAGAGKSSIEVSSFQWGSSRGISSPTGASADRESSAPSVSEIVITRTQDSSSPNLFRGLLGKPGSLGTCTLKFVKGNQPNEAPYLTITLTNAMVAKYSLSSGGDRPTESITLNFTKITFTDKVDTTGGPAMKLLPLPSPSPKAKT
jgi:type VI secretion system secreted protein Hcp